MAEQYERRDCTICHVLMDYAFPASDPDPAIDSLLGRFQVCRHGTIRQKPCPVNRLVVDVYTGETYAVQVVDGKFRAGTKVYDGDYRAGRRAWLKAIGVIEG